MENMNVIKTWKDLKHEEWGTLQPMYRPAKQEEIDAFNKPLDKNDSRKTVTIEMVYRWKLGKWYWRFVL